jgi:ribonuclease P protein component
VARQFTLGKNERLKSRKIIEKLFTEGKTFSVSPFRVYYQFNGSLSSSLQCGTGVSSRHFKKAVDRNRVKRVIREAWRLRKTTLKKNLEQHGLHLYVFIIYTARELPEYKEVYEKMNKVIERLSHSIPSRK